ncbi:hypothetical protein PC2016_0896 [Pseudoalteromonas carrageenovora]|uniref:Secreted protein n=1 Tax=Pseudoalteromonas carrageenovora IAM 12662 TaxID=1314868 RepID=A0A2K4X7C2_PSEVC|nr:hypothetical protein [Pseudoalteromonas carrageenovora]MBE0382418.1 hypothetical protein [Pseudoalteromonas carrageenovora IAM 12662]QBJ71133.1 hypothetical protein PC2016_0896 [Pseudoalteromonas carrageenovora]GEB69572.1 hypothetical protein PCA01_02820 [Pseudoalteromonas carrageenovora]SOU40207.1 conserved exported protein of unknown function [Pseudoalteromonas carrageenovora IAM 12662]|tara:strand:- start:1024 stop:1206 length:183 start_codon:yes stop_codon:yes gene_type:complete
MEKVNLLVILSFFFLSSAVSASPLVKQWAGSGMDADKYFCEYGDGEVKVIYGNQNCPLSN